MTHLIVLTKEESRLDPVFQSMSRFGWTAEAKQPYDMTEADFTAADVLYVCGGSDQIYLSSIQPALLAYLERGGHFVINDHVILPWLPFLQKWQPVPPRPFTNWAIRPGNPGAYFGRMDFATFHVWKGVLGQYSRGYSEPPPGADWLCLIGQQNDLRPVDWVWRYPGGGRVFMHCGDNIHDFCSPPDGDPNLTYDILNAIVAN